MKLNGTLYLQITISPRWRYHLLAAQKDPEHYKHIIVRVTGFSCPFVNLSEDWQNEVLSRNYYN